MDFRNAIIILTSNLGHESAGAKSAGLGFSDQSESYSYSRLKKRMMEAAKRTFKPELLNRFDDVIVFRQLDRAAVRKILDLELSKVEARLSSRGYRFRLTPSAMTFLIDKGFSEALGARPLRRAVSQYLEDPFAEAILKDECQRDVVIRVSAGKDQLTFGVPKRNQKVKSVK